MTDAVAVNNPAESRFEVRLGDEVAIAEYRLEDDVIVFHHTVVPEAFEGRGVGGALVKAGLAYAEAEGRKVIPTCSFFAGYIARHPELHRLVHPDHLYRVRKP